MNYTMYDQNLQRQKNYDDARKDMIQAMNSFSKLDDDQKRQLIYELASYGTAMNIYSMMQQRFG